MVLLVSGVMLSLMLTSNKTLSKYISRTKKVRVQGTIGCTPNSVPMVLIGLI